MSTRIQLAILSSLIRECAYFSIVLPQLTSSLILNGSFIQPASLLDHSGFQRLIVLYIKFTINIIINITITIKFGNLGPTLLIGICSWRSISYDSSLIASAISIGYTNRKWQLHNHAPTELRDSSSTRYAGSANIFFLILRYKWLSYC